MKKEHARIIEVLEEVLPSDEHSELIALSLRFFLRNPYESLVIADKNGFVRFMDRGSEKYFGLSAGGACGIDMNDLLPDTIIPNVLKTGTASIGRVVNIKGVEKISSAFPLKKNGELLGAIGRVIFDSLEEFDRVTREKNRLQKEIKNLRQKQKDEYQAHYTFDHILGTSKSLEESLDLAKRVAMVGTDALITGESGVGKELFAQAIHNFSGSEKPFVRVNCPAIPFELAESEFFGYERGAFSGANRNGKKGKFEVAENGTIFLDEINSLPLSIQAKLLRILQERELEKVGGTKTTKLNVRVIAATNLDLKDAMKNGHFREDLYYRIAGATISIPPLRERREDISIYVNHFIHAINRRFGTQFKRVSEPALAFLMQCDWPGNVRDLINVLEQACLKEWTGEELTLASIPENLMNRSVAKKNNTVTSFRELFDEKEHKLIAKALKETRGNKRKAAKLLNMPRSTFYYKLQKYKIANIDL